MSIDVRALRRDLHRHPEPGFLEFRTAAIVVTELTRLGVAHRTGAGAMDLASVAVRPTPEEEQHWADLAVAAGADAGLVARLRADGTAVVAEIEGDRPGPVWGLRVDMDALPIAEDTTEQHLPAAAGFGSRTSYMHACGHDGHTAIGIALAARLADRDFPGTLRILFQPAEEGVRGALPMLRAGAVEGVERMLAVHLGGDLPTGSVVGGVDDALATTKWRAVFTGEAAHAASAPERGRNALAAAAQASLAILGLPRYATADTRVNVGTFRVDGSANIIPAKATITYETRAALNDVLDDLNRRTTAAVTGAAAMYDVTVATEVYGAAARSVPDPDRLADVAAAASRLPAVTSSVGRSGVGVGSDDAHLLIHAVQEAGGTGTYVMVGASNPAPHHHPRFDVDEAALDIAVDLLERIVRDAT
jgi:aminobenzoyl-glutamate utilization protein A